jgi:hypothetical protein
MPRISDRATATRRESGVAAVEAALILPVLLLLVMGVIDLGRALATKQEVTHATREAVRVYAVTHDSGRAVQAFARGTAGLSCDVPVISPDPCIEGEEVAVSGACAFEFVTPLGGRLSQVEQIGSTAVMRCGG